MPAKIHLNLKL